LGGAKSKQNKKSLNVSEIKNVNDKLELEIEENALEGNKEEGEEDSVLADAEDEEYEEESDQGDEEVKPPGGSTIAKGKSSLSKKISGQKKGEH